MRREGFAVTPAQRAKIRELSCLVCDQPGCDPAHLIDRSLCPAGADDVRAVVPLCRRHHVMYDGLVLDLLPFLERRCMVELGFAVERYGLLKTVRRVSGPRGKERAA